MLNIDLKAKWLKPLTSFDSDSWSRNAEIARLQQDRAAMQSRKSFLEFTENSTENSMEEWQLEETAQKLRQQFLAYRQQEQIATKHRTRGSMPGSSH
jgi:hypothetical protein